MILEYHGKSFVSKVIEFLNWRKESHTSWSFAEAVDGYLVGDLSEYEAWIDSLLRLKGFVYHRTMIGDAHTKGTRIDLYELKKPLINEEKIRLREFYESQIGKKYDFRGICRFLTRLGDMIDGKWFCSEYIIEGLFRIGRIILERIKSYKVFPGLIPQSPDLVYLGYIITGEEDYKIHMDTAGKLFNMTKMLK